MYIEERIDQLENIAVDHGNQIDMIATGLATLTTAVNKGFADAKEQFAKIDLELTFMHNQFIRIDNELVYMHSQFTKIDKQFAKIDKQFTDLNQRVSNLELRMDRLEMKMDQRFDEIILLIKSKL